ncbi:hypothetical protein [Snodgrassella alvi]|jgi:hypothetical protein|uniref:hypothetical protein n=1 Tax=Snodgrassella alvi TaxID=1196083 RepID=UPI000C1EA18C|nr:hypothetical protein [Snodgrassella alvi]PIT10559.1 hypothetical protein BGI30_05055 [Snodgrassella alvi]PIT47436.1 hypothetical protein BHC51_05850 [Snodgrassella alvi]PIT58676.1 hypothetical protein BHC59_01500 [Snodgrassella alvi]
MLWKKILWWPCLCASLLVGCAHQVTPAVSVSEERECDSQAIARVLLQSSQSSNANSFRCVVVARDVPVLKPERTALPDASLSINRPAIEVSKCLHDKLQSRFNLPREFYKISSYPNGSQTLALVNPFTQIEGLQIDVLKAGMARSMVNVYSNGTTLSQAWKKFPELCQ